MLHKESMKQHVKVIAQSLKLEGGFIGEGISSSHVSKVSKRVLRILSACALLETAEGVSLSPISVPRALGHLTDVFTTAWMRILFTVICMAIGVFMIFYGWRQNRQAAVYEDEIMEMTKDSSSVASVSTDWGLPLTELQERVFHVLDSGTYTEEALCEWLRRRCSRRLAVADSNDRETVRVYHEMLMTLAMTRRNLLTCDDVTRRATYGHLRHFSRMSPRADSPTERLDASEIAASISEAGRFAMETGGNLHPQLEPMEESSSDISESVLEEQRRSRYRFMPLEEASDPELWMDVRHGGPGSSDSSMDVVESRNEPAAEPLTGNEQFQQNLDGMVAARESVVSRIRDSLASAEANGLSQEEIWHLENLLNYFTML